MSLVDIDKNDDQRRMPQPNASDVPSYRMAHKTSQFTYRESGSSVIPRMVAVQGGFMWIDADDKVTGIFMYIPEVSTRPIFGIIKEGFDVFTDGFESTVDRPKV